MHINKLSFCLLLVLVVQLGFVDQLFGQDGWVKYKADAVLSFQVDVPAEMGVKTKKIPTDLGEMTTTTYAHEGKEEDLNFLYVINVVEYPSGSFPADSTYLKDQFLDEALQSMVYGIEGDIVYQSNLSDDKNGQGKLFRLKYDNGFGVIKGKTYIKDDVFITLQVYTTRDKSLNEEMDYFLDSFTALF